MSSEKGHASNMKYACDSLNPSLLDVKIGTQGTKVCKTWYSCTIPMGIPGLWSLTKHKDLVGASGGKHSWIPK